MYLFVLIMAIFKSYKQTSNKEEKKTQLSSESFSMTDKEQQEENLLKWLLK